MFECVCVCVCACVCVSVTDKAQSGTPLRQITAASLGTVDRFSPGGLMPDMRCLLPVLVLLTVLHVKADQQRQNKERHYYVAAQDFKSPLRRDDPRLRPLSAGLLGPTLRAEEGETIVVTFRNMASGPHSIHPHGIAYGKQSEGANYFDNTSQKEKEDDVVQPNGQHVYYWEVTPEVSPQEHDPTCLTYTYVSHIDVVEDYNSGLIGTLLVCKSGSLDASGQQVDVHQEYVFLFGVFDESQSKYEPNSHGNHVKYTVNGYVMGSLPDVSVCAFASVSLHLVGMSSEPEVFSVHMNGQVLRQTGHKVSSVGLISGSTATAGMVALHAGRWLLSSHTVKHMEAGMHGFVDVKQCDGFKAPKRRMTVAEKRHSKVWTYYIAAEEITWDYAPNMDFKLQYLRQSSKRIGGKYKKAVYTLYKNESFTDKLESKQRRNELGILGPVIKAQIRDVIKIVFKNKASRPYSIYPHGLTIEKSEEGVNYPAGGNQSHGVQPGETHTYLWRVVDEDEPSEADSQCLTRLYHSAVDTPRDIASGLIGQILICKSQSLNIRGVQLKADKEQHAMMAVFDENKSWYMDENVRKYCDRDNDVTPLFVQTFNLLGELLGFCNGEIATWHVSSIGAQDYIQTVTFYGHPFELNGRTEEFLSLYPMTGETISMRMDNIGVWLMASLNSHETTKGVRVKFNDVECYRDYQYETSEYEEKKRKPAENTPTETDNYTDMFATELGLRSRKNQSTEPDVEELDLSALDYDAINVPDGDLSINLKNVSQIFDPKPNTLNETSFSNWLNLTAVNLLNQSISENSTHVQNNTAPATFGNSSSIVLKNDSITTNSSVSPVASIGNDTVSTTENITVHNATSLSTVGNVSTEISNLTETSRGNLSSVMEAEGTNVTLTADDQTPEVSEEKFTRGDVFLYSEPPSDTSVDLLHNSPEVNATSLPHGAEEEEHIVKTIPANSGGENVTHSLLSTGGPQNVTANVSRSNASETIRSERRENVTALPGERSRTSSAEGFANETDLSLSSHGEELSASDSTEEVLIYLSENKRAVIKTTAVKTEGHNWTYEVTHQMETEEMSEDMMKYLGRETTQTAPPPKKKLKRVNLRDLPDKGKVLKTKKKKEYKPQSRSSLPFSPRGFHPDLTPRGSRPPLPQPVSDEEEELINAPVIIGVPRPDFSDYELYVPGDEPDHLDLDGENVKENEYEFVTYMDPYKSHEDFKALNLDDTTKYYLKLSSPTDRIYFIAAEEVEWDYSGYGKTRQDKSQQNSRETKFTKVVFRGYMDSSFNTPDTRGEMDEHLGILGPVIRAEVDQRIMVVFRNKASRPYSIHPNGVLYNKQTEGLSYEDGSEYWYKYDNDVQPNTTFTYIWKVPPQAAPTPGESHCRTWAYYSGVNPEKDIHSGLIGPLLVCREGTLSRTEPLMREFTLLFMTFDESQSWYYEQNHELMQRKSRRRAMGYNSKDTLKFHSINGVIYNLKGLRMYTDELVCWHLINVGSPKDFQSVHFHGQTFIHKKITSYRQAVYPLLPGSFATLEMYPSKPGLWQLETEVGLNQQKGMQTLFLVLDNECYRPLGLESGSVKDEQITAINSRGYWEPHLARLNNNGKINAWSTEQNRSWIQVDFQRPVVISQVATQGARQMFQSQFVEKFSISYSTDHRNWNFYKSDSRDFKKVFTGNQEVYETKKNTFNPPVIGRFIRLHPLQWCSKATVRMEFYGCELDGCSVPLGMESGLIEDHFITASSSASSWYSGPWKPSLARLNKQGTINAWQAKYSGMDQWLQVELPRIKKITGIITQGAKSLGKEMYVMSYSIMYSGNGIHWIHYTDDDSTFKGNSNNNDHVRNYIHPPIFSRFVRIVPRSWWNSITMRIELLGCEFE
uniref:Coagulation factor V n=1 Tax=Gasterosteus aculeatus aculeatus TaxID=481459 RepID=G3P3P6_GASAC